jgi:hypothetical protein
MYIWTYSRQYKHALPFFSHFVCYYKVAPADSRFTKTNSRSPLVLSLVKYFGKINSVLDAPVLEYKLNFARSKVSWHNCIGGVVCRHPRRFIFLS